MLRGDGARKKNLPSVGQTWRPFQSHLATLSIILSQQIRRTRLDLSRMNYSGT